MAKLFEDSLGNLEYLLLGLTFLGVMYLVMKQAKYTISLQRTGMAASGLGPGMAAWAQETSQGYPQTGKLSGFSNGSNEPPVWNATPFDPSEYDQAGSAGTTSTDFQTDITSAGGAVQFAGWSNIVNHGKLVSQTPNNMGGETLVYSNGARIVYDKRGVVVAQFDASGKQIGIGNGGMLHRSGFGGPVFANRVGYTKESMTDSLDKALVGHGAKLS